MAEGQIYPPQILRGLDSFMRDLSRELTGVTITKSRTEDWFIDIAATWKLEDHAAGVPLSISWQQARHHAPQQYVSVGSRKAKIMRGKIDLDELGFDEPDSAASLLGAIRELMNLYDEALQVWDNYLDDSETYVVARLNAAAQKRTRLTRELRIKLAAAAAMKEDDGV